MPWDRYWNGIQRRRSFEFPEPWHTVDRTNLGEGQANDSQPYSQDRTCPFHATHPRHGHCGSAGLRHLGNSRQHLSGIRAENPPSLGQIIVTAQKREENLQNVPLSIQAIDSEKIEELHLTDFADYAAFLPSLSYQSGGQSGGSGFARPYMRGVASGGDGNHSASPPSVGMYLDEQPITTISGALDIHMYDIARVEALAGPQGTLYGASSEAGTVRIITNKPDPTGFQAGYDLEGNSVDHGGTGYTARRLRQHPYLG